MVSVFRFPFSVFRDGLFAFSGLHQDENGGCDWFSLYFWPERARAGSLAVSGLNKQLKR